MAPIASAEASWVNCPHAKMRIRDRLVASIPQIEHFDMDELEVGCEGAHLKLLVVSDAFEQLRPLDRQRMVHLALKTELSSGAIHSLPQLQALTRAQWRSKVQRSRTSWVEERLRSAFDVAHLEILDVTNGHAIVGFHDGSKRALDPNGLELQLTIVSAAFEGLKPLARQQLVQAALGPELSSGVIHALPRMKTWTPTQWQASKANSTPQSASDNLKRQRT